MATFYLDLEGGNDSNDGTSFANRWLTITSGATAARTAPGDTIRVMGSPAPTSLGINGTWTGSKLQAGKNIVSSTNASPIAVTVTGHGYSTGDTVVITSHTTNTNANGTWEISVTGTDTFTLDGSTGNGAGGATGAIRLRNNTRVKLASALTMNIASCGNRGGGRTATWTANGANITTSQNTTTFKEGDCSDSILVAGAFTTGMAAYVATGTLDLSAYQGVSFWFNNNAATTATVAGDMTLTLCSDTAGATPVHTISIPGVGAATRWIPVYWDNGSALSSSIQSVALNVVNDRGASSAVFLICNIIAVKASGNDSLNLTSLIGKNTGGSEPWVPIQSINGTRVMLDQATSAQTTTNSLMGYTGTTETVTTYKRETIKTTAAAASSTAVNALQDSGTLGSPITFEGGYDRTNMSTKTLETWMDGQNSQGIAINVPSGIAYNSIKNFGFTRYSNAINFATGVGRGHVMELRGVTGMASTGILINDGQDITASVDSISFNSSTGFSTVAGVAGLYIPSIGQVNSNGSNGLFLTGASFVVDSLGSCDNNSVSGLAISAAASILIKSLGSTNRNTTGITLTNAAKTLIENAGTQNENTNGVATSTTIADCVICNGSASSNTSASVSLQGNFNTLDFGFINYAMNDSTEVNFNSVVGFDYSVFSHKHDQTAGNHILFLEGARITVDTSQRHTASGYSWKFNPTSTARIDRYPVHLSLAKVALLASVLKTIAIWVRRDATDIVGRLIVRAGQASGITVDQSTTCNPSVNTWTQYSVSVMPTENCVIEIFFECYDGVGTTNTLWIDDLSVT